MISMTSVARRARRAAISRRISILVAAATAALAGCSGSGDSPTAPGNTGNNNTADPKGLYDLRTIDNAALPGEIYHGPYFDPKTSRFYNQMVMTVNRGSVNIIANNRWAMTLDIAETLDDKPASTTFYADGTYEMQGTQIVFHTVNGDLTDVTGTLDRGTLTFSISFNGSKRDKAFNFRR